MACHTLSLIILLMAVVVSAKNYNESYYSYIDFPWPYKWQYGSWWPRSWWAEQLNTVTKENCNMTFNDYNAAYDAGQGTSSGLLLYSICYQHAACLLDNLDTDIVANYQSASVVLGLMPSMLSMLGPSLAEVALLSQHRPLLSLLISVGAPAIWPSRIGVFQNPTAMLRGDHHIKVDNLLDEVLMKPRTQHFGVWLSLVEYALILGAVANVFWLSWEIGFTAISSWRCTSQYLVFLWVMLALAVHGMTVLAVALRTPLTRRSPARALEVVTGQTMAMHQIDHPKQDAASDTLLTQERHNSSSSSIGVIISGPLTRNFFTKWRSELKPCIMHIHCRCLDEVSEARFWATAANFSAGCSSNIHFIVGVIIFSSLQFISVWEVCNRIMWRFVMSAAVCRIVIIVEVTAIRKHTATL